MEFILWDTKDGHRPTLDENRDIISDGLLGRIGPDNVYLTTYASYPDEVRPADLEVGSCIQNVRFSLSGETGSYDIYRVK